MSGAILAVAGTVLSVGIIAAPATAATIGGHCGSTVTYTNTTTHSEKGTCQATRAGIRRINTSSGVITAYWGSKGNTSYISASNFYLQDHRATWWFGQNNSSTIGGF